ncbi:MAG: ABC transporter permease [Verrucomicrobiae bacterium]|nr:ABC transporter permease [Verrucomicrobiae bacterium]
MDLLRKELRALRPFFWLILLLAGLDALVTFATEFPDQHTIADVFDDFDAEFAYFVLFAISFALGQTLIGREKNENTLEFLDGLPVSRGRVYWTKWLAGYLVLSLYLLTGLVVHLPLHFISATSDNPSSYPEFWASMLAMDLVVIAIYLSIGMALAFWGRFGLLAVLFYLIGVWILHESGLPSADFFDPLIYGRLNVIGSTLIVPWKVAAIQLGAAFVFALLGLFAFESLGRHPSDVSGARRAATPLFITGLIAACVVSLVTLIRTAWSEATVDPTLATEPVFPDWETTRLETGHFVFIYPNNQAESAEALAAESDEIHSKVVSFFHAEPKRQIIVDLTSQSPRHAGTAYWGRVRMNLRAQGLESRLPAVLGHELCHVYIDQLSDNHVSDQFDATRFFHEGLASWVEYRFFRPPEELPQIRRVAAVAHDRERIRFEDLASSARLSEEFAPEWVYPLGEVFSAAVIETWGEDAPEKIVRAFGRDDAPTGLNGIALWQDTFQAAGYDLETAIAAFFRKLDDIVADEREWLDKLPRFRGQLVNEANRYGIRIRFADDTDPARKLPMRRLYVRFRNGPGTAESDYQVRRPDRDGIAWISRDYFPGGSVEFQIIHNPAATLMMPLFDPWVSVRTR